MKKLLDLTPFRDAAPEKFFVILGLVFGLAFLFITPPFQGSDEPIHFLRAYDISIGRLKVGNVDGKAADILPLSLQKTIDIANTDPVVSHPNVKYNEHYTRRALSVVTTPQSKVYDLTPTVIYAPVSYLPAVTGITFARVLHMPPIAQLYAGRLAGLIFWLAFIYAAIKLIPFKKWALVFIGLLPMAVFQAATLNTDVMAIGSVILFTTYALKLFADGVPIRNKELILLFILGLVMSLSKQIMFIFLPIILLIRNSQFESRLKAYAIKACLIIVPLGIAFGWYVLSTHNISLSMTYPNNADPTRQIGFVLHSPWSFINVLWNSYFFSWGDYVTTSFIGTFGWADAPLSGAIVTFGYLSLALLVIADYSNRRKPIIPKQARWLLAIIGLAYIVAISAALYTAYTPVGFKIIVGLQGRYFLPLGVVVIALGTSKWLKTSKRAYIAIAKAAPTALLVASTITLFVRYHINNV